MTIGFSIFFHEIKGEKNPKNVHFKKVIKKCLHFFFKHDPRYRMCSHVLLFDATVLISFLKVIDALLMRLGKKVQAQKCSQN